MLVEILVLGRDEGVDDELGDCLDRDIKAALAGIFGEQRAVGGVHARHHCRLVILQLGIFRQVLGEMPKQPSRRRDADEENDRPAGKHPADEAQQ